MPLFETVPADTEAVQAALRVRWPQLTLGTLLKQSQNHIYEAHSSSGGAKYAVRVVPDPDGTAYARVQAECCFVQYLSSSPPRDLSSSPTSATGGLGDGDGQQQRPRVPGVCPLLPSADGSLVVRCARSPSSSSSSFALCVVAWADGEAVDFLDYRWMTDPAIAQAWGAWLARLHAASRAYVRDQPTLASSLRSWDDLHDGLMRGYTLHPADEALMGEKQAQGGGTGRYIPLHSDVNISNFHLVQGPGGGQATPTPPSLQVFDWDQASWGWIELDLVGAALTPYMLAEAGSVPLGEPVPEAHPPSRLLYRLRAAYDEEARRLEGGERAVLIDEDRLERMLRMRRDFYYRFASRALREGREAKEEGGQGRAPIPPGMEVFLQYTLAWAEGGRPGAGAGTEGAQGGQ